DTPQYIALSHRWGSSQHLTTKTSNYVHHILGIKFSHLPRTFQDAAAVALFLGIRLLRIDALCIIQDDTIDWHREAFLMGQTLSPPPPILIGDEQKGGLFYVDLRSNFKADVDNSELSGWGWVLQERFPSPRTLHFTQESIFLEDASGVKSEEDSLIGDTLLMKGSMALLTRWFEIVERYCKTDLTFEKDKLPAISRLARYIQAHTGDEYHSGFWKSQFPVGLLWAPDSQGVKRSMSSRAPSWSWASVDGPVQY
ncbi:hypothetical protein CC86DRAFT_241286, partial [Ophiobolus disseminans]